MSNDWVVRYQNRLLQLERVSRRMPARRTVQVCEARDGQLTIRYRDRLIPWRELLPGAVRPTPAVVPSPSAPALAQRRSPAAGADHPWRQHRYKTMRDGGPDSWRISQ